jgi:PilZ domain
MDRICFTWVALSGTQAAKIELRTNACPTDSPDDAVMNEHRVAPRRRMLKAGTIEFGGGGIDCTVRNLSETGAALEVVTPLFIPDRFTLFVPSDQFKRPCHIVWRKEKRIGIAFD